MTLSTRKTEDASTRESSFFLSLSLPFSCISHCLFLVNKRINLYFAQDGLLSFIIIESFKARSGSFVPVKRRFVSRLMSHHFFFLFFFLLRILRSMILINDLCISFFLFSHFCPARENLRANIYEQNETAVDSWGVYEISSGVLIFDPGMLRSRVR